MSAESEIHSSVTRYGARLQPQLSAGRTGWWISIAQGQPGLCSELPSKIKEQRNNPLGPGQVTWGVAKSTQLHFQHSVPSTHIVTHMDQ